MYAPLWAADIFSNSSEIFLDTFPQVALIVTILIYDLLSKPCRLMCAENQSSVECVELLHSSLQQLAF